QVLDRTLHRLHEAFQARLALTQGPPVLLQRVQQVEIGPVQHGANLVQAHAQLSQKQDLLQAEQRRLVVPPVAVGRLSWRAQQADRVIVMQRPDADSGNLGKLANGVARFGLHAEQSKL